MDREQQLKKKKKNGGKKERKKNQRKKFTRTQFRVFAGIGRLRRSRWRNRCRRWPAICIRGARGWWTRRRKAGFNAHASYIFKPSPSLSLARYSCTRKLNPNARLQPPSPLPRDGHRCVSMHNYSSTEMDRHIYVYIRTHTFCGLIENQNSSELVWRTLEEEIHSIRSLRPSNDDAVRGWVYSFVILI